MALNCHDVVKSRTRDELFLVYQSDFLSHFNTRLVIPLVAMSIYREKAVPKLNPVLTIDNNDYVLMTHLAFSARLSDLLTTGLSLRHEHDRVRDAFDFLVGGI